MELFFSGLELIVIIVIIFVIFFVGILGNVVFFSYVICCNWLMLFYNIFFINLVVGDFLILIVVMLFLFFIYIMIFWLFGELVCKFSEFIYMLSIIIIVFMIIVFSVEWYCLLMFYLLFLNLMLVFVMLFILWFLVIMLVIFDFVLVEMLVFGDFCYCVLYWVNWGEIYVKMMVVIKFICYFVGFLFIIIVCYCMIGWNFILWKL